MEERVEAESAFDDAYSAEVVTDTEVTPEPESSEPEETQETQQTDEETTQETPETAEETEPLKADTKKNSKEYQSLVEKYAKRMQKDVTDPAQLKDVQTVVDKEIYIKRLEAENAQFKKGKETESLTEFEKEQLAGSKEETKPESKSDSEKQSSQQKTEESGMDALYKAELEAWQKQDYEQLDKVRQQINQRQLEAALVQRDAAGNVAPSPLIQALVARVLEQNLGGVLPGMTNIVEQANRQEARSLAITDLEKVYGDITTMFNQDSDEPLVQNGQKYPNTPLNRILAENPELMDIRVQHKDPKVADRLSFTKVYKAAYRIYKKGLGEDGKTQRILESGIKTGQRTAQEQSRQALNKGSGATATAGSKGTDYVDSLRHKKGTRLADF